MPELPEQLETNLQRVDKNIELDSEEVIKDLDYYLNWYILEFAFREKFGRVLNDDAIDNLRLPWVIKDNLRYLICGFDPDSEVSQKEYFFKAIKELDQEYRTDAKSAFLQILTCCYIYPIVINLMYMEPNIIFNIIYYIFAIFFILIALSQIGIFKSRFKDRYKIKNLEPEVKHFFQNQLEIIKEYEGRDDVIKSFVREGLPDVIEIFKEEINEEKEPLVVLHDLVKHTIKTFAQMTQERQKSLNIEAINNLNELLTGLISQYDNKIEHLDMIYDEIFQEIDEEATPSNEKDKKLLEEFNENLKSIFFQADALIRESKEQLSHITEEINNTQIVVRDRITSKFDTIQGILNEKVGVANELIELIHESGLDDIDVKVALEIAQEDDVNLVEQWEILR